MNNPDCVHRGANYYLDKEFCKPNSKGNNGTIIFLFRAIFRCGREGLFGPSWLGLAALPPWLRLPPAAHCVLGGGHSPAQHGWSHQAALSTLSALCFRSGTRNMPRSRKNSSDSSAAVWSPPPSSLQAAASAARPSPNSSLQKPSLLCNNNSIILLRCIKIMCVYMYV